MRYVLLVAGLYRVISYALSCFSHEALQSVMQIGPLSGEIGGTSNDSLKLYFNQISHL